MKVKGIVSMAALLGWSWASGQDYPLGVRTQALGGSGAAFAFDAEGQLLNPALPAGLEGWSAALFYSHPFGIREIALSSLCLAGGFDKSAFGLALVRLGHENFEDHFYQIALAYDFFSAPQSSSRTNSRLALGLQAVWRDLRISNYGRAHALIVNFGSVARWGEHFSWGAKIGNLLNAKFGAAAEPLPRELSFGIGYQPRPGAVLQFDIYKEDGFPLEMRGGVEYRVLAPLSLRLGLGSNPDRLTCGLAVWLRPVIFQATAFSHADLGWTQQYGVTLRL